ncbi:hypothetical protein L1987_62016 [Smallanthus sonchifolius]|uniref:Uncharacterized protein n=1 Tax=Smallanthus sonchifolius TaxID=185202 RepID=A0ACB9C985_9ASTR|nr:hypothetical protein L1987_62016 [Smallanthus sonchifolius]
MACVLSSNKMEFVIETSHHSLRFNLCLIWSSSSSIINNEMIMWKYWVQQCVSMSKNQFQMKEEQCVLMVSIFGQHQRLKPLYPVCDYIVEFVPSSQNSQSMETSMAFKGCWGCKLLLVCYPWSHALLCLTMKQVHPHKRLNVRTRCFELHVLGHLSQPDYHLLYTFEDLLCDIDRACFLLRRTRAPVETKGQTTVMLS